jgi:hypothetical protein
MRDEIAPEDSRERLVADVQAPGIGAEGGHHHTPRIADEAPPPHAAPTRHHDRDGMQVAADLAVGGFAGWLVAEREHADPERFEVDAADARHRLRIVIAGDPDPVAAALQAGQGGAVGRRDTAAAAPSWKLSPSATTVRGA